jgi:hypothetical protein
MQKEDFVRALHIVAAKDTSADPDGWTDDNPLWGHCAVVSLLAQDYFGGNLMRGSLEGNAKYVHLRSHYWNALPDEEVDFTAEQYPDVKFSDLQKELRSRERVLSYEDTQKRYALLKKRFEKTAIE